MKKPREWWLVPRTKGGRAYFAISAFPKPWCEFHGIPKDEVVKVREVLPKKPKGKR